MATVARSTVATTITAGAPAAGTITAAPAAATQAGTITAEPGGRGPGRQPRVTRVMTDETAG